MSKVPPGWFWMGSDSHHAWEQPRHRVFTHDYEIAETAVTRQEYTVFLLATGHAVPKEWTKSEFSDPDQPVIGVNWFDANAYCHWLSGETGQTYRLPTEAEWERACRGGCEDTEYAWGNLDPEQLEYYRGPWTGPRPSREGFANGFGLFHMGDNVHEWCSDWYAPDYYGVSPEQDPAGPETGTRRVSRGGSWRHRVKASRNAHRSSLPPDYRYTDYGFRIVMGMKPKAEGGS